MKTIVVFLAVICSLIFGTSDIMGDTIKFKNGKEIHGKVVKDEKINIKTGYIRIQFSNGGWFQFRADSVKSIETNDLDEFEMRKPCA